MHILYLLHPLCTFVFPHLQKSTFKFNDAIHTQRDCMADCVDGSIKVSGDDDTEVTAERTCCRSNFCNGATTGTISKTAVGLLATMACAILSLPFVI